MNFRTNRNSGFEREEEHKYHFILSAFHGIFYVEEKSFWYRHRKNVICKIVSKYVPSGGLLFDVGGADGFFSSALEKAGYTCILFEPAIEGTKIAKERGIKYIYNDTFSEDIIKKGTVPNILLLDVLEHIEDDQSFLNMLYQLLGGDGLLFLTVPAYQFLITEEEKKHGHFRRYNRKTIIQKLSMAGFSIDYLTYFFTILPLPLFIIRKVLRIKKLSGKIGYKKQHILPRGIDSILSFVLSFELKAIGEQKVIGGGEGGGY